MNDLIGVDEFFAWHGQEPRAGFTKATVSAWRVALEAPAGSAPFSINARIAAVRKLAVEAADNGPLAPALANGITRVKGIASRGVRLGNWLSLKQAQALLNAPMCSPGKRCVPARPDDRSGPWPGRRRPRSRRTLSANGRTPLAETELLTELGNRLLLQQVPPQEWRPSLLRCNAPLSFSRVLSAILTAERSFHFQPRRNKTMLKNNGISSASSTVCPP